MAGEGVMISRAIKAMPKLKDEAAFRIWLEKTLKQHYQDIKTLFETTTDIDLYEKLQRDNTAV